MIERAGLFWKVGRERRLLVTVLVLAVVVLVEAEAEVVVVAGVVVVVLIALAPPGVRAPPQAAIRRRLLRTMELAAIRLTS